MFNKISIQLGLGLPIFQIQNKGHFDGPHKKTITFICMDKRAPYLTQSVGFTIRCLTKNF
jgi:hypothetical protein